MGGVSAFAGTLIGGGSFTDALEAAPGGAVGGVVFVALAGAEAVTAVGVAAAVVVDTGVNAASDAWAASAITGPLPTPSQTTSTCP